jgi:ABC-type Zn uptake system ZnuABC Zn-binding protein ZnuA
LRFAQLICLPVALLLAACSSPAGPDANKLVVVASSQVVGDVVSVIGANRIDVTFLIPAGTDPHAYEPAPQDAVRLAEADIIFVNGFGLEQNLEPLFPDFQSKLVIASDGIQPLTLVEEGEAGPDPHVWMNPQNVAIWADNIAQALSAADPPNAASYQQNADAYKDQLQDLDSWAQDQINQISVGDRILVTDHESLGYFADHYDFEIIGSIIPSYSTQSEPSAGELADLETAIQSFGVKAIFVGKSLNPDLAARVAQDTGVQLAPIYTESFSEQNGPAATYLEMMRFDIETIVTALR